MKERMNEWKTHQEESENIFAPFSELFKKIVDFLLEQSKNGIQQTWNIINILVEWHNKGINIVENLVQENKESNSIKEWNEDNWKNPEQIIPNKLAQDMRLMKFYSVWWWSGNLISLEMSDDEIDEIKPSPEIIAFSKVLESFPELYTLFQEALEKKRQSYREGSEVRKSIFKDKDYKESQDSIIRDDKRIAEGRTPINPNSIDCIYEIWNCHIAIVLIRAVWRIRQWIDKIERVYHRYDLYDRIDKKTARLIYKVLKWYNRTNDFYEDELVIAKKTLEVLELNDDEKKKLLDYGWIDDSFDNYPEKIEYKDSLKTFIEKFRNWEAYLSWFKSISSDFFTKRVNSDDYGMESSFTNKEKREIIDEVLLETNFSQDELLPCLKKNIIKNFEYTCKWEVSFQESIEENLQYLSGRGMTYNIIEYWLIEEAKEIIITTLKNAMARYNNLDEIKNPSKDVKEMIKEKKTKVKKDIKIAEEKPKFLVLIGSFFDNDTLIGKVFTPKINGDRDIWYHRDDECMGVNSYWNKESSLGFEKKFLLPLEDLIFYVRGCIEEENIKLPPTNDKNYYQTLSEIAKNSELVWKMVEIYREKTKNSFPERL